MAFTNTPDFQDDFRKVGADATAGFAPTGTSSNPTEHASSENLDVAGTTVEDDDLEEDEDLDDEEDEDADDEDDLEDDDEDEDELEDDDDEEVEDDEDEDDDDEEDEDEELEDDAPETVRARLADAEKRARS